MASSRLYAMELEEAKKASKHHNFTSSSRLGVVRADIHTRLAFAHNGGGASASCVEKV